MVPSDNHSQTMRQHGAGVGPHMGPLLCLGLGFRVNRERGTKLHGGGGAYCNRHRINCTDSLVVALHLDLTCTVSVFDSMHIIIKCRCR